MKTNQAIEENKDPLQAQLEEMRAKMPPELKPVEFGQPAITVAKDKPNPFGENAKPYLQYALNAARQELAQKQGFEMLGVSEISRSEALRIGMKSAGEINRAIQQLVPQQKPSPRLIAEKLGEILVKKGMYSKPQIDSVLKNLFPETKQLTPSSGK